MTKKCNHEGSLHFDINVEHVIDADMRQLQFKVHCKVCGTQFEFPGIPHGASFYNPTVSIDNQVVCLPMVEVGKKVKQGLPGLVVNRVEPQKKFH
jgi:hypothetical protein